MDFPEDIVSCKEKFLAHTACAVNRFTSPVSEPSVFVSVEDILDEVSGLTVNSPDESLEEGPRLVLQSPGGLQEDKAGVGTGQRVGFDVPTHNFDMNANTHRRIQATEQR